MKFSSLNECTMAITDDDIIQAMKHIPGYLDITPSDFMEVYRLAFSHAMSRLKNAIKAEQIMTRSVIAVSEDTPLTQVIKKMAENNISGLPVVKDGQTVSGIISEKDFLKRMNDDKTSSFMRVILQCIESKGCLAADFKTLVAADIMSSPCITTLPKTPVTEVAGIMDQENINRVPVIDDKLKLVGIIARSDIVQTMC
ncbi:MAG: CBS domain-containing protein [Desulfobacula sp.]|jgi:CBS domain-containing membrane protein|uniref:CBS domain-containing protein n=1 Tax=Desulfobacula sp. TaxID=2593537 RepID=UPI001DBDC4D6|nr:CBS domain-containing protein [Desulfobacula sp.]MBT3486311.1 CBS domain-containing protein [Desulfobacula sp.]MBT3805275.1 CBS domain-containing protein [Desulfobacula sp.]MBT4026122.1 CBS domain-containing protein [Desulfobacula sp.]MBT4198043.1 CBS domain-containing protein [Desulfobacula sp.]